MNKLAVSFISAALAVSIVGCQTPPNKEQTGTVVGGVLGGVLGSQVGEGKGTTAAIIVGTLIGAAIGSSVGRSMDEVDRMKAAQTLEHNRTGQPTSWHNPDSGVDYTVTPTRTYETSTGPCREYTMDAEIGGKTEQVYGTACRQQDGSWKVSN